MERHLHAVPRAAGAGAGAHPHHDGVLRSGCQTARAAGRRGGAWGAGRGPPTGAPRRQAVRAARGGIIVCASHGVRRATLELPTVDAAREDHDDRRGGGERRLRELQLALDQARRRDQPGRLRPGAGARARRSLRGGPRAKRSDRGRTLGATLAAAARVRARGEALRTRGLNSTDSVGASVPFGVSAVEQNPGKPSVRSLAPPPPTVVEIGGRQTTGRALAAVLTGEIDRRPRSPLFATREGDFDQGSRMARPSKWLPWPAEAQAWGPGDDHAPLLAPDDGRACEGGVRPRRGHPGPPRPRRE